MSRPDFFIVIPLLNSMVAGFLVSQPNSPSICRQSSLQGEHIMMPQSLCCCQSVNHCLLHGVHLAMPKAIMQDGWGCCRLSFGGHLSGMPKARP